MIELRDDSLVFPFPEVHPDAKLTIGFQRTLRIPDDDGDYPLPPGLGRFPLRHVDDFAQAVPEGWLAHGGVMLPMYQSEAMWLNFDSDFIGDRDTEYPFAIMIAAGKINAVDGEEWSGKPVGDPQNYVTVPEQPWLDGYCVEKGIVRQFVAMPLGAGYTAEEQLTGKAEHGGMQIMALPMKKPVFERLFPKVERSTGYAMEEVCCALASPDDGSMGLAPGGRMRQEIYDDEYGLDSWDVERASRCFVHIANSMVWRNVTGQSPPTVPPTASEYESAGLPWFEYYGDGGKAVAGAESLASLKSVAALGEEKKDVPLAENESVTPEKVVQLRKRLRAGQVREGTF